MKVLALIGPSGSGKDTLATYLSTLVPTVRLSFADYPKKLCSELLDLPLTSFYAKKNEVSKFKWKNLVYLETSIPEKYEPDRYLLNREIIQKWGQFFKKMNPDVWVDRVRRDLCSYFLTVDLAGNRIYRDWIFVITDCRFMDEKQMLDQFGCRYIELTRCPDPDADWRKHESEQEWKQFGCDSLLFNCVWDLDNTQHILKNILQDWGWIPR